MPKIGANGTELYYEVTGTSSIPLVLVHGAWADHHNWDATVPLLSKWFRVLTYDRRGHSESARPATQGSLYEDAMDLAALIEGLDLAPVHMVGNSMGGSVCLRLAVERPELFRSLTVHEPPLFRLLADDLSWRQELLALLDRIAAVEALLRAGDAAAGARLFVDTVAFGPGTWDALPEPIRRTFIANAPTFLDERQDPDGTSVDLTALARFPAPALLTRGDRSLPLYPAVIAVLERTLPQARRHVFTGAGHAPHVTMPKAFVGIVSGFLMGLGAPALPHEKATPARYSPPAP